MKTRVIAFANQKGGVAKTTTCLNVGAALAKNKRRVLLVDMDPQGNLTSSAGIANIDDFLSTYELLTKNEDIADLIFDNVNGLYDVLPTDIRLSNAEMELVSKPARESILRKSISEIKPGYDYILIDCPPSLSILTMNCLTAADEVIIPLQAEFLALKGVAMLIDTINTITQLLNPTLKISGVVMTMFDNRTNLSKDVLESVSDYFSNRVFDTKIRKNVALAEAPANGKDIFSYSPHSNGAVDYMALAKEIMNQEE